MGKLNEFRQDLVSGEWVLFSTERSHSVRKFEDSYQPPETCPFENFEKSGNEIIWRYPENDWEITLIKNKFPAVVPGLCSPNRSSGCFSIHDATGEHDIFVFKDHDRHFADLHLEEVVHVLRAYKKRYKEIISMDECAKYIMLFHNFGKEAGASIYHPHSQIISTPILPPDISHSLHGARKFYNERKKRVYDDLIKWELKEKVRIVYENEKFVAFCPFVSKFPYEVRIFPKDSHAHFEQMPDDDNDMYFAQALSVVMKKIKLGLGNPPFSFFIHTAIPLAPDSVDVHEYYTWHLEVLPKIKITAGFEMGTGIEINVIDPDEAAKLLREAKID